MPVLILFLIALLCACLPAKGQQDATYQVSQADKKMVGKTASVRKPMQTSKGKSLAY
jgi:ABC-type uncharacterized transport system auxiliary subunit